MKILIALLLGLPSLLFAQNKLDTTKNMPDTLQSVTVRAFGYDRNELTTSTIKVLAINKMEVNSKTSFVQAFNSIAGVRMEERSPGSYRINIRGSSLRSPFGVRNVKVYWNDIPVTDPGGNTYFNQFANNNFNLLEIAKGPSGSMYGASTGGLIQLYSFGAWKQKAELEYLTGSNGLLNVFATFNVGNADHQNIITYAHNQSDGYRDQSKMRRDNFSWSNKIKSTNKQVLTANVLFTDMFYQTPGGLTLLQYQNNPMASRPAAGNLPSAQTAKATIYQINFLAGLTNEYFFNTAWKNTTTFYGAYASIKNPGILNYGQRSEPNFGGRSYFTYTNNKNNNTIKWITGIEYQSGYFNNEIFTNVAGNKGILQTDDAIGYNTYFIFSQLDLNLKNNWFLNAGASINQSKVNFTRINLNPIQEQGKTYNNEIAPRVSLLKKLKENLSAFATISQGFSPPSISELLPTTGNISTYLEAERGTDYEAGIKWNPLHGKLKLETNIYDFNLKNALVTRKDSLGANYYINAGNTKQKGIEISADYTIILRNTFINYLHLNSAYTYSHYTYGNLVKETVDYSGKSLPSVPLNTLNIMTDIYLKHGLTFNSTYYLSSKIFLNDANTAVANAYHLLGIKLNWKVFFNQQNALNFYAGIDNLLNEDYSLGNDINDPNGRYYNAAPKRNFYVGFKYGWGNSRLTN